MPMYDQPIFREFKEEICPVAERITKEILCLPMYYQISQEEQNYVIDHLVASIDKYTAKGN